MLGDVDGNGVVDLADIARMQVIFRGNTPDPTADEMCAGDINGDGRFHGRDLALLIRIINGKLIYDDDDSDDTDADDDADD